MPASQIPSSSLFIDGLLYVRHSTCDMSSNPCKIPMVQILVFLPLSDGDIDIHKYTANAKVSKVPCVRLKFKLVTAQL